MLWWGDGQLLHHPVMVTQIVMPQTHIKIRYVSGGSLYRVAFMQRVWSLPHARAAAICHRKFVLLLYGGPALSPRVHLHEESLHMLKLPMAGLLAAGLLMTAARANALQVMVTQTEKNSNGSVTYHFAIKTDVGETLSPGGQTVSPDFVTVYNFYGLLDASPKSPDGWKFTSEEFGRTPTANGYPTVLPLDVPNTPNLTWTVTKAVPANVTVEGFTATTTVATSVQGQYAAQTTRSAPAASGLATANPIAVKQATISTLPTPTFLAATK
jgi:hypothetical protein